MVNEALHILRRIAEEQPDLMGKIAAVSQTVYEPDKAALKAGIGIARTAQRSAASSSLVVPQTRRAVEIQQHASVAVPQRQDTQPLRHQKPVQLTHAGADLILRVIRACKEIAGFYPGEGRGRTVQL